MKDVCLIKFNQMKPIFATYFLHILQGQVLGFHTLISFLNSYKNLQFLIFLRYHGPYLGCQEFDRLYVIVCCFDVFSPELAGLRTETIVWLLKVKYLLHYFRSELIFYFKNFCYKSLQVSLVYSDSVSSSSSSLKDRFLF